jgi:hypothetical protein
MPKKNGGGHFKPFYYGCAPAGSSSLNLFPSEKSRKALHNIDEAGNV